MSMDSLRRFYSGKRVWISGHSGFKGSWISFWLFLMGAKVGGYSLPPEQERPALFNLLDLSRKIEDSVFGDIRDAKAVKSHMLSFAPEIVIHMAAQPLVRRSYKDPLETYATNVLGTAHVLDAARYVDSVKAIISVTTDKCYENLEWFWPYRETDQLGGHDPYSSSKACAEIVSSTWRRSFLQDQNKALATARAGNVIGGGDFSEDRIIPDFIEAIRKNTSLIMRSPLAVRPWQHVLDAVRGYLVLAQKLYIDGQAYAEAYNFSPEGQEGITVKQIIEVLIEKTGKGSFQVDEAQRNVHEATFLRLDPSKSRARLGWQVLLPIEPCLAFTAEWYEAYLRDRSVEAISTKQIEAFEKLIP
ncbi:MAG: CDP-glucose 4,6-dehydratase [Solidesulfovibrio sp.]